MQTFGRRSRWIAAVGGLLLALGSYFARPNPLPVRAGSPTPVVSWAVRHDVSRPLLQISPVPPSPQGGAAEVAAPGFPERRTPPKESATPLATDPLWQAWFGLGVMPAPQFNFAGLSNEDNQQVLGFKVLPPDTNGDIGPNHYVQWVNLSFAIWEIERSTHTATLVYGPAAGNTLWSGFGGLCESHNNGDVITLYDTLAGRWLMSQFAFDHDLHEYHQCVAVSGGDDPTSTWNRYDFLLSTKKLNDYSKFGVWPGGYFLTYNQFADGWKGQGAAALERDAMLAGAPARIVQFDLFESDPNVSSLLPADLDGPTPPPPGAPAVFATVDDDMNGYSPDQIQIWQMAVDWSQPEATTFNRVAVLDLTQAGWGFDSELCGAYRGRCIPQPVPDTALEGITDRAMYRLAYRNFGDHESFLLNHTVDANRQGLAGIRWYELRRDPAKAALSGEEALSPGEDSLPYLYQAGTYAPDGDSRWMGSIAMDRAGNVALGYSISSSRTYPSIRYTGRLAGDPLGTLPQGEAVLAAGGGSQTGIAARWGDYSMMGIDPVDDCTFWYTQEYYPTTDSLTWHTRIGSFRFPTCTGGPRGNLQGHIRDAGSPLPVAAAALKTDGLATLSDTAGAYRLLNVPAGEYTFNVSAYGYYSQVFTASVPVSATATLDLSLQRLPPVTLQGSVHDAGLGAGERWPLYARVEAVAGEMHQQTYTDPLSGTYTLQLYAGIPYPISVSAVSPGYAFSETHLTLLSAAAAGTGLPGMGLPDGSRPLTDTLPLDFGLSPDPLSCLAPGYRPQMVYFEDFEAGDGGYTATYTGTQTPSSWEWGLPTSGPEAAYSGSHVWATNLAGEYTYRENSYLLSPPIDLSAYAGQAVILSWHQWLHTQLYYDFASAEVSHDNGLTWQRAYGEAHGPVSLAWSQQRVVLAPEYAVSGFRFRLRLTTNAGNNEPGWYVDDVGVGVLPVGSPVYFEDFEAGGGGYQRTGNASWEWGVPGSGPGHAASGLHLWATNLGGNYNDSEDGFLLSPGIDLSAYAGNSPVVLWKQWLDSESGFDWASLEASRDGGRSWQTIYGPLSGSVNLAWQQHAAVLPPAYAVAGLRLRFRLSSDMATNAAGWYVDDVEIRLSAGLPAALCRPLAGGLAVGHVYTTLGGRPLSEVLISHGDTRTYSFVTPEDPAQADGLYILFAPPGPQDVSATFGNLSSTQSVMIDADSVVVQDFFLDVVQWFLPLVKNE